MIDSLRTTTTRARRRKRRRRLGTEVRRARAAGTAHPPLSSSRGLLSVAESRGGGSGLALRLPADLGLQPRACGGLRVGLRGAARGLAPSLALLPLLPSSLAPAPAASSVLRSRGGGLPLAVGFKISFSPPPTPLAYCLKQRCLLLRSLSSRTLQPATF